MQKYWNFRNLFLYIAICCGLHGSAEEANTSGLVGPSLSLTQVKALLTDMCFSPIIHGIIPE